MVCVGVVSGLGRRMTPTTEMKTRATILYCITILLCCVVLGFFGQFAVKHYVDGQVDIARYGSQVAYSAAQTAKQETMQDYIDLEAKRTAVQSEVRKIVIAEWKKCKKGKC
jgi:hypothetical protein